MRDNTMQKRVTVVLGLFLAFAMAASLILPMLTQNIAAPLPEEVREPTAMPTLPPPPDTGAISFDDIYLHPSGLFTVGQPTGWTPTTQVNNITEAQVTMRNDIQQSVVEVRVIQPAEEITAATDLNAIFDQTWLQSTWREYSSWTEATRNINDRDQLVIDFNLRRGQTEYIARQIGFTDGEWVYAVRVVMPPNASAALRYVLDNVAASLVPNTQFVGTPLDWDAYHDVQAGHIIRYPVGWQVTDAAVGAPASISGDGVALRVEAAATVLEDEDAAAAWVQSWRSAAEIISVEAIEQNGLTGYQVAYALPTLDGPAESGVAVLLNGMNDTLHIANLRVSEAGVDFNSDDAFAQYADVITVLRTFSVFSDVVAGDEAAAS